MNRIYPLLTLIIIFNSYVGFTQSNRVSEKPSSNDTINKVPETVKHAVKQKKIKKSFDIKTKFRVLAGFSGSKLVFTGSSFSSGYLTDTDFSRSWQLTTGLSAEYSFKSLSLVQELLYSRHDIVGIQQGKTVSDPLISQIRLTSTFLNLNHLIRFKIPHTALYINAGSGFIRNLSQHKEIISSRIPVHVYNEQQNKWSWLMGIGLYSKQATLEVRYGTSKGPFETPASRIKKLSVILGISL